MDGRETARTYAAAVARRARLYLRAHAEEIAQAALIAAAVVALFVAVSYLAWAWRDVGYACEAQRSDHCTKHVADPVLRAERDVGCRVRAGDCTTSFVWVAGRALRGDALAAVSSAWAHARVHITEIATALALVLFSVFAARQILLWVGQPFVFLASLAQASPSSGKVDASGASAADGAGRQ